MELEDIKAGMKVVVTKKWGDYEDGWENDWIPTMDKAVGRTFEVEDIDKTLGVQFAGDTWHRFPWQVLEPYVEEFLNESLTPFQELTDEQKLLIIREKEKGNVEAYVFHKWVWTGDRGVCFDSIYRTKPIEKETSTPLEIPWQFIKPEYKWAAMDSNKAIWAYRFSPHLCGDVWEATSGDPAEPLAAINVYTEGIIWNKSLTKRPE